MLSLNFEAYYQTAFKTTMYPNNLLYIQLSSLYAILT